MYPLPPWPRDPACTTQADMCPHCGNGAESAPTRAADADNFRAHRCRWSRSHRVGRRRRLQPQCRPLRHHQAHQRLDPRLRRHSRSGRRGHACLGGGVRLGGLQPHASARLACCDVDCTGRRHRLRDSVHGAGQRPGLWLCSRPGMRLDIHACRPVLDRLAAFAGLSSRIETCSYSELLCVIGSITVVDMCASEAFSRLAS